MNLIICISAYLLTYRILKFTPLEKVNNIEQSSLTGFSNFLDSILSLFIFYFTQIVFTELLLGIFGILYLRNVILLNTVIFLIILYMTRNKESSFGFMGIKYTLTELLGNKVILLGVSVILGFGLVKVFINLVNPPFGWDSLNYHFTFAVEWLKHGNLYNPITICDDPAPSYYPINGSLFFLWLIFPLKNVFLADLGQMPFFVLAFLAVFNISRKLRITREISFYAAMLFILIPNLFKQLGIAYVDIMVAALFLVCVNFLFLLNEKFSIQNVLIYSMSLGLLLGTKTVALPYTGLLFIPFLYFLLKNMEPHGFTAVVPKDRPAAYATHKRSAGIPPSRCLDDIPRSATYTHSSPGVNLGFSARRWINKAYLCLIFIIIVVILGGFSYIRNFFDTGNPLYPLDFGSAFGGKIFGRAIFKGVINNSVYRAHFKIEDYRILKLLFHEGLGMQTILFILPAIFLALPATIIKRRNALNLNLVYFLILPVLIYLNYRYIIPLANTRYLYPLLGIGMIIGFYTVGLLNIPKIIINILVFICTLASMSELAKRQELVSSIIVTILLFFVLTPFLKTFKGLIRKPLFIGFFPLFIILNLVCLNRYYTINEYPRYSKMVKYSGFWPDAARAWEWLNQNTNGNNIAYVGRPVPFPLYGTNFKNNVYYVSVNKTEPAKLHYFPDSHYHWGYDFLSLHKNFEAQGNYRGSADYSTWLNNLLKRNTDYLFIYSLHQTKEIIFPLEYNWAKDNPEKFKAVFANDTIKIYKVLR